MIGLAAVAQANNLDRKTATDAAKEVARRDCHDTSGCEKYFVRKMHRVTHHKWLGKVHVISHKNHERFNCRRQVLIKLDGDTGDITYSVSARRCKDLGAQ